jgi:hypothetical protein
MTVTRNPRSLAPEKNPITSLGEQVLGKGMMRVGG